MSTCIAAIMSHQWAQFSLENIEQARLSILQNPSATERKLVSQSGNAEWDFVNYGSVVYRFSSGFSLNFCRKVVALYHSGSWSGLLMHASTRRNFLAACEGLAKVARPNEIMILPEGTYLDYELGGDVDFGALKDLAVQKFGAPDLNIEKFYSESEIKQLGYERVHYFVIQTRERVLWRNT